jgi:radical SAM protein with 4Fe4S-binding SPASM domain
MSFESFPLILGWELTLACNLRCRHCGSSAGTVRPDELTTSEALALCDELPDLLVQEVDFTGGEPLLRCDWETIAARLVHHSIPVNVLTNGMIIDTKMITRLRKAGIRGVGISLDGLEKTHDSIRNHKGSYRHVIQALELFEKAGIPQNVITTVNKQNLVDLAGMHELLGALGTRRWRLQPLLPMGRVKESDNLALGIPDIRALGQFIRKEILVKRGTGPEIICSDGLDYVVPEERPWGGCQAGIISCGVMSDGRVKGCLSLPDEVCEGTIRSRSLWDIWFDPQSFAYTRQFAAEQLGPHCRDCEKQTDCKGGCSSSSYTGSGVFHNDPTCFFRADTTPGREAY